MLSPWCLSRGNLPKSPVVSSLQLNLILHFHFSFGYGIPFLFDFLNDWLIWRINVNLGCYACHWISITLCNSCNENTRLNMITCASCLIRVDQSPFSYIIRRGHVHRGMSCTDRMKQISTIIGAPHRNSESAKTFCEGYRATHIVFGNAQIGYRGMTSTKRWFALGTLIVVSCGYYLLKITAFAYMCVIFWSIYVLRIYSIKTNLTFITSSLYQMEWI